MLLRRLLALALFVSTALPALGDGAGEYEVKAAFLYNFTRFVRWPEAGTGPFAIGVLGQDPFAGDLDRALAGKAVDDRPLVVRRVKTVEESSGCGILFISSSEAGRLPAVFTALGATHVLTVGESKGFCASGGMVEFVEEQGEQGPQASTVRPSD
jgi:hypothetical protein